MRIRSEPITVNGERSQSQIAGCCCILFRGDCEDGITITNDEESRENAVGFVLICVRIIPCAFFSYFISSAKSGEV